MYLSSELHMYKNTVDLVESLGWGAYFRGKELNVNSKYVPFFPQILVPGAWYYYYYYYY